ncbi:pseudoazurin [Phytobacter sp. V91]|uniref:pseudoazurin n=1 Tax=Phytobacter sp. V91 TaxID=3369425 RepID=UPI003F63DDBB
MKFSLALTLALSFAAPAAMAVDHEVKMLNYGKDGGMVFEPPVVKAAVGDTVTFVPENSSHYVQSYVVPEGAGAWKSKLDEKWTVTLDKEGIYLYYCPPHLMMSMIGLVQVGKASNLEAVEAKAKKLKPKLVMKGDRLDKYLADIDK